jgi:hypothetical protein
VQYCLADIFIIAGLNGISSVCFFYVMVVGGVFDEWKYRFFAVNEEKRRKACCFLSTVWAVLFPPRNQTVLFCVCKWNLYYF